MIKWHTSIQRDCYGIIAIYQRELALIFFLKWKKEYSPKNIFESGLNDTWQHVQL